MPWPNYFSPYITVRCPDGTTRLVLKNPERAFSVVAADWNVRFDAVLQAFKGISGSSGGGAKKKVNSFVKDLDKNYAELQAHYQAAYLQYAANPCDKRAYEEYIRADRKIRDKEFGFREIEYTTERIAQTPFVELEKVKRAKRITVRKMRGAVAEKAIPKTMLIATELKTVTIPKDLLSDLERLVDEFKR